jgi:TRAP-type C4-dicarboxylate transport system substrate-binding protein
MLNGFLALGADAATLSFGQLRDALRSGQFQAQENPIGIIEAAKFQELQTHLSLTGHIYDPALFLASGDLIEDLTPAQAVALTAAAQKGAKMSRQAAAEAQRDGVGRLKAAGMIIVEDIDSKAFIAAARPYLESLAGVYGAERIKSLTNPDA